MPQASAIFDLQLESPGVSDAAHGRRREDQREAFANMRELGREFADDRPGRFRRVAHPLIEWIQNDEHRARRWTGWCP